MPLKADLNYRLTFGPHKGKTVRYLIEHEIDYIDALHRFDKIKLTADALCAMINARSDRYEKLSKLCDKAREY